jgi:hypothetical protein
MCEIYSTKEKVDLFFDEAFQYTMIFYAITSYMHISLNFLLKK